MALENKLGPAAGQPGVSAVRRAPCLRRIRLAVAEDDAARPALYEELLRREERVLILCAACYRATTW